MNPPAGGQAGYSKRSRLDKLGVKPDMRVTLVGLDDAAFRRELRARTSDVAESRPRQNTDMILFAVDGPAPLKRLATLQRAMRRDGAIWVVWPKGQTRIKEDMVRAAAIAQGLVDVKVIAFSETMSGLKLVIPLARR
jgi:tRNA A58 N-methylase Trm61